MAADNKLLGNFGLVGIIGPLLLAIYRGLPLDCLDYEKAILKENQQDIG